MIGSRNRWQHYGHECQAPNHSPVQMIKEETSCRSYGTVEDGIRNLLGIVCCETSERFKLDRSQVSTIILGDDGYCGIFKHIWSCHHLIWSGHSDDKYGKSLIETVCQILVHECIHIVLGRVYGDTAETQPTSSPSHPLYAGGYPALKDNVLILISHKFQVI